MRALSGKARLAGVIGWPISHSRSPRLHGFWLEELGIDGAYLPFAVRPERLAASLEALALLGLRGINVTLPHKERVLALCSEVTPGARRIGAVNTIRFGEDGTILGSNTDGFGFIENLRAALPGWRADAGPAVLLGAGGASRALAVALAEAGVPEIRLANRTASRAARLVEELGPPLRLVEWHARGDALDGAALLVNGTVLGMAGQPPLELDLARLPRHAVVNDIVYVPIETALLAAARARGNPVVDGLGMLLHQARPGFAAWFEREPTVSPALRDFVFADLAR
jgi:shikimate dehydrogenase